MSGFLAITTAVADALRQSPALAADIQRGRATPAGLGKTMAIRVAMANSTAKPIDLDGADMLWQSSIVVALYARAAAGVDGEQSIDQLFIDTWARLQALTAPPGVVGMTLDPTVQWDEEEADQTLTVVRIVLRITHRTTGAALAA